MELLRKHADTVSVIAAICLSMLWMNGKFNNIDKQFSEVEKEIAVIKTVLFMKNILPSELVKGTDQQ